MAYHQTLWQRLTSPFKANLSVAAECFWAVDVHSHLVPGIDDGVKNTEETLACLMQLAQWGIKKIITTPHINGNRYPHTTATILAGKQTIQTLVDQHQLPLLVDVAAEYLVDDYFFDLLQKNDVLTFGVKQYLLIETGWTRPPNQMEDILFRIQSQGYTPVLAHPERYHYYHQDKKPLLQFHELGCLFQLNWMSLSGRYGTGSQKQARFLLQERLISFVGSDMHRPDDSTNMALIFNQNDLQLFHNQPLLNASLLNEEKHAVDFL